MNGSEHEESPKAFISYCWSSDEHVERVIDLASELRASGVDVLLDKWDLREGQEAAAFMEKMVTDSEVSKVLIVSDRMYVEKSNGRIGGAGFEAQIISPKIFEGQDEGKFVALVFENDEHGKAYLPTYYTSRIFIDFTDSSAYSEKFEQLVRWIYGKPLHVRPEIGRKPAYLQENFRADGPNTGAVYRRAIDALQNGKSHSYAATDDYLNTLTDELDKLGLARINDMSPQDIQNKYDAFIPFRDEVIGIARIVLRTDPDERFALLLHSFFERLIPYFSPSIDLRSYSESQFNIFKFFAHELFLYVCAITIKYRNFEFFNVLVGREYYDRSDRRGGDSDLVGFPIFYHFDRLLEVDSLSNTDSQGAVQAKYLSDRAAGTGVDFLDIKQADLILYLRAIFHGSDMYDFWFPLTLGVQTINRQSFELFSRAASKKELSVLLKFLGLTSRTHLDELIAEFDSGERQTPSFGSFRGRVDMSSLLSYSKMGTKE